jgi:hypothetical protein
LKNIKLPKFFEGNTAKPDEKIPFSHDFTVLDNEAGALHPILLEYRYGPVGRQL